MSDEKKEQAPKKSKQQKPKKRPLPKPFGSLFQTRGVERKK